MSRWAITHPASGAIVMVTTIPTIAAPWHLDRWPAPTGVDPGTHWWNGWSFAPREDATIALAVDGNEVIVECPADAWVALPDGSIALGRRFALPVGRARVCMVGHYRGEVWFEPEGTA